MNVKIVVTESDNCVLFVIRDYSRFHFGSQMGQIHEWRDRIVSQQRRFPFDMPVNRQPANHLYLMRSSNTSLGGALCAALVHRPLSTAP